MLHAFHDAWFQKFSDWAPLTSEEARSYLAQRERARQQGHEIDLAVTEADASEVMLGGVSLNGVDLARGSAAIGCWLSPEARGRGMASRAVRLLSGWAFADLQLARIELTCGSDNEASQRVAERCGFTREGLLRSHIAFKGGRRDTVVFGLLPGELV
jgi:RimJ/RimL family protein N-acetyltransferase